MKIIRPQPITDAILLSSSVPETDYAAWSSATTYGLGAYVIKTSTHRVYKSLQAGNLNHDPAAETDPLNPVWWLNYSATNRWMMFDKVVGQQTSQADTLTVTLKTTTRVDSVAVLNVSASTVRIKMTDDYSGVVYDKTYAATNAKQTNGWYAYYFYTPITEFTRKKDLIILDLPPYSSATLEVTLTDTGNTVQCGEFLYGLSVDIGGTEYGFRVGIQDYSVKTVDQFGNYSVLQRGFAKRGNCTVMIDNAKLNNTYSLLASLRSAPTLYVGSDLYEPTMIYGFSKDFDVDISYPTLSICSFEIEGLT